MKFTNDYVSDWRRIATNCKRQADWHCIRCGEKHDVSRAYVLTVHHFDGNKANNKWWNLLALCQRCHLKIQARVDPHRPYLFEHSDWLKPYVAGFYAFKYLQEDLTRAETIERLNELLQLERVA